MSERKIDPRHYRFFRAQGCNATESARWAIGRAAVLSGEVDGDMNYDPEGCQCDYDAFRPQWSEEGKRITRCPHTFAIVVYTKDKEHSASLGAICVMRRNDPYLEQVEADLAYEVITAKRAAEAPTPSAWMAL